MIYKSKKYKIKDKNNKPIDRYLIIRQNENEIMPYVSIVNKYYDPHYGKIRRYEYAGKEVCSKIARFCDFLFNEKGLDPECDLGKITYEHAQEFLFYYGTHPKINSNEEPGIVSQINARNAITLFLLSLKNSGINHNLDSHFLRKKEGGYKGGMLYELTIYSTKSPPKYKVIRDSPKFFVEKLLEAASWYDQDLFMLMSLQIYAGLRPGEAVNVRMTSSCYGPGIIFEYAYSGAINSICIDLSKAAINRPLRSDLVRVGYIKKPREVKVYSGYVNVLFDVYTGYIAYTCSRNREAMMPLVTNTTTKKGFNMAFSYDNYRKRFKSLCETYVFPALINEGGERRIYAEKLMQSKYGPHMLREYFTCRLFEAHVPWSQIMALRGDSDPNTVVLYLLQGGALKKLTCNIATNMGEEILSFDDVSEKFDFVLPDGESINDD